MMADKKFQPTHSGPREDLVAEAEQARQWFFDKIEAVTPKLPSVYHQRVRRCLTAMRVTVREYENLNFKHEIARDQRGNAIYSRNLFHHVFHIGRKKRLGFSPGRLVIRADGSINEESLIAHLVLWLDERTDTEMRQSILEHNRELLRNTKTGIKELSRDLSTTPSSTKKNGFELRLDSSIGKLELRNIPVENLHSMAATMLAAVSEIEIARDRVVDTDNDSPRHGIPGRISA